MWGKCKGKIHSRVYISYCNGHGEPHSHEGKDKEVVLLNEKTHLNKCRQIKSVFQRYDESDETKQFERRKETKIP